MSKLSLLRGATRITATRAAERIRPRRPAAPGAVPGSTAELSTAWLTHALCRGHEGAAVTGFEIGTGSDGTSSRRPLTVSYNEIGTELGLPTALYTKSSPNLLTRLFCGLNRIMVFEGQFYLRIRPSLKIETPVGHHAVWDERSGRSMLILEDIVATRGVRFGDPTTTRIDRSQAEDMVDVMAGYHRAFWGSERLDSEFSWLVDASEWQHRMNAMMGFGRMFRNGLKRSRDIMPASIVRREHEMWPALLRSLDLEAGRPRTLIHQDVHSRNWYVTGDGRMGVYDWQANGKGSWAIDVPYALACALTVEDRRAWEQDLLRRYLDRLGPVAPSFEQAWLSYRQQIIHGLAYWLATIGHTRLQPEFQPHEVCVAHIERMSQAAVDFDTLDAVGS